MGKAHFIDEIYLIKNTSIQLEYHEPSLAF